ncbi:branched-chain amino acid aminotransferase [Corynebacterium sp. P6129]|uniref:branched-chain amino acid aminotransferase n=1 Tax=Corynebacterium antarcticum TaxID=2800405 RepID=UPI002260CD32|nr:branched-chain amino acid aminotransferase [Corynebacterium antarcticum]MCX7491444.1 branched-chain amino acid aminotransferase [Corynebacterium antarcticum]
MSSLTFEVTPTDTPTSAERRAEILADPGFGRYFTDHMVTIEWTADKGWHDARVRPYGPLTLDPSTSVLHYGQAIFEGLKAYRHADGSIRTFRPDANGERMQQSAARMAMPELPVDVFIESIRQLVDIDRDWVPAAGSEEALYLRPFMIATESTLGVHPSTSYTYAVIASPAGAYFSGGVNPVSVWLCEDFVRACPGGTGAAKFAGNYAASLKAQAQAAEKGCDQVVWLDAIEHSYVEEMGGMNLFFVYGDGDPDTAPGEVTVATPALSGSLLPGVTRRSLLQVAEDQGFRTEEFRISTGQWREDAASGKLREAFACGTAAVITPVGHVKSRHGDFDIADGGSGDITMKLRGILTGIQKGEIEDTHGWLHTLVD